MYGTYRSTISIELPLNQEDYYNKSARRIITLYYRNIALRKKPLLYVRDHGTPPPQIHYCAHAARHSFPGLRLQPDDGPHVGPKHVVV